MFFYLISISQNVSVNKQTHQLVNTTR